MGSFALVEVGFIGRVVGVRVPLDFNVSLDGCATGVTQPSLTGLPLVIPRFTEEGPAMTTTRREVLLFAPACVFVWVSSSCPSPQTREDFVINTAKCVLTHQVHSRSHCILSGSVPGCNLPQEAILANAKAPRANPRLGRCVPSAIDRDLFRGLGNCRHLASRRRGNVEASGLPPVGVG